MQGADLVKNFAFQFFFAVLQQRAVNVAANHLDSHIVSTPYILYCNTHGGHLAIFCCGAYSKGRGVAKWQNLP